MSKKDYDEYIAQSFKNEEAEDKVMSRKWKAKTAIILVAVTLIATGVGIITKEVDDGVDGIRSDNEEQNVTIITVESALSAIGELATSRWDYCDVAEFENTRQLFKKFNVPFTTNSVEIAYSGVIKAGYQMDDLNITVNNANRKIYVDMPEPQVLDNYIADESIEIVKEKNNIFNPVNQEYLMSQLTTEKNRQLEKALEEGLYQKAREEVEEQIGRRLAGFEYEVIFGNV